jgi:hypothetical protein
VVDGDIAGTETPYVGNDQQPWSWADTPGAFPTAAAPPVQQQRKTDPPSVAGTVTMSTDAALARYGGLQLTNEQQRQKERRERMMRSAQFMEKGKENDVK